MDSFNKSPWATGAGARPQMNPALFSGQLGQMGQQAFAGMGAMQLGTAGLQTLPNLAAAQFPRVAQPGLTVSAAGVTQAPTRMMNTATALQLQQQIRTTSAVQQGQQNVQTRSHVGEVTKMEHNYGFVDGEIFFQHSAVYPPGNLPRVGDKVIVEAQYNANMPFKWNAVRVQLLSSGDQSQQQQSGQRSNRWEPATPQSQAAAAIVAQRHAMNQQGGFAGGAGLSSSTKGGRSSPDSRRYGSSEHHSQSASYSRRSPARRYDRRSPPPRERSRSRERRPRTRSPPPPRRASPTYTAAPRRSPPVKRPRSPTPQRRVDERHGSVVSSASHHRRTSPSIKRARSRSSSPRSRAARPSRRVQLPRISADDNSVLSAFGIRSRYPKLYTPSDFMECQYTWNDAFALHRPLPTNESSHFHIMAKGVPPIGIGSVPELNPPDADYSFSAKVMLLALPDAQELYKTCLGLRSDNSIDRDKRESIHRAINFLVGTRGKNEVLAIGGPWSPSLDGSDPANDPGVLVRTAIRTTKALAGIDLSACSQWFKFVECRYRRQSSAGDSGEGADDGSTPGADAVARVHTVVIYVPDVWSTMPTDFDTTRQAVANELARREQQLDDEARVAHQGSALNVEELRQKVRDAENAVAAAAAALEQAKKAKELKSAGESATTESEDKTDDGAVAQPTNGPTHWSSLDVPNMKVAQLKVELAARNLDQKGLKNALAERLQQAIDAEREKEVPGDATAPTVDDVTKTSDQSGEAEAQKTVTEAVDSTPEVTVVDEVTEDDDPAVAAAQGELEAAKQRCTQAQEELDNAEKAHKAQVDKDEKQLKTTKDELRKNYTLPTNLRPSILVFPSATAKGGRFECKTMSLHALLNYREDDNKEHSFEVALFAEAFADMLNRDAAFTIYRTLALQAPGKDEEAMRNTEPPAEKEVLEVTDSTDEKKDEDVMEVAVVEKKSTKDERTMSIVRHPDILAAFAQYDTSLSGIMSDRDVETILFSLGLGLTRSQITRLLTGLSPQVHNDKGLHYRQLTDATVVRDTLESRREPALRSYTLEEIYTIAKPNTQLLSMQGPTTFWKSPVKEEKKEMPKGPQETTSVIYEGAVVDIACTMKQLERLQAGNAERDKNIQNLQAQLTSTKDANQQLTKRKMRLEEDLEKTKKKLQDTEKSLRNSELSSKDCKQAVVDMRRLAERIVSAAKKALPDKKKEETSSPKKTSSKTTTPTAAPEVKIVDVVDSTNDEAPSSENSAPAPDSATATSESTTKTTPANENETPSETPVVNGEQKE